MPITANEHAGASGVVLADIVRVRRRFLRSVSLERDFFSADPLDGYIVTASALASLQRIALGVRQSHGRAVSLTGPYGSGKSAFGLYASKVLATAGIGAAALRAHACQQEAALSGLLFAEDAAGFWPVLLTGSREPIARAMWRGLLHSLDRMPGAAAQKVRKKLVKVMGEFSEDAAPTAKEIVVLYAAAAALARKSDPQCRGLFVVMDELGKFLEYAAIHPEQGDMQVLQEMAEFAVRSGDDAVMLVTILHQAFEDYAQRLSTQQRVEWQKVQGRFADIPFGDGPEETLLLMASAIERDADTGHEDALERAVQQHMDGCRRLKLFPPTISAGDFQTILRGTYPLHPLTLRIMPYVFRRFGQNERSLFSFLSSEEPFGFQEFLHAHVLTAADAPTLRVHHLYDYIVATLGSTLYSHPTARLWSETEEALFRLRDGDPLQSRLLKTIGLLHILGEQTRMLPSREVLTLALGDHEVGPEQVEAAIARLEAATLITFRQFKNAYRPYEGSDIDVDARLREARSHFSQGSDGVKIAGTLGVTQPVVARRHSYETGTFRFFEVRYCRPAALREEIGTPPERADGLLLFCLARNASELAEAEASASSLTADRPDVVLGLNVENEILHEAAVAVECLLWVQDNTPELWNDRVAAREVRERLQQATVVFQSEWENLLRPQPAAQNGSLWFYQGEAQRLPSFRRLQELVSHACKQSYPHTPRLLNELINRRQISSTAAAARRDLIEAMIQNRHLPRLGITGYPPQASMYRSVLENTGIHRPIDGTSCGFTAPDESKDAALAYVWKSVEDFLFSGAFESKSLDSLNKMLRERPFGIADGVIPVLLCAVLLCHEAEVALYEEGQFVTDLDAATFERMIKRPEDYRLQGYRISGERRSVIERFAKGLLRPNEDATLANVVRVLYRQYNRLPEYTIKTRRLDDKAQGLRDLLKGGQEPEQLLFLDLPLLLGTDPFVAYDADPDNAELFFSRWNSVMAAVMDAYEGLLNRVEKALCDSFGVDDWQELRTRASTIAPHVSDSKLKSFVLRVSDESLDRVRWLESVAAGVVNRPPNSWGDAGEDRFNNLLPPLVSAFRNSELVSFERSRRRIDDDDISLRLTVTQNTGQEDARVAVVRKQDVELVEELADQVLLVVKSMLQHCSEDVRVVVVSKVAQEILRGNHDD